MFLSLLLATVFMSAPTQTTSGPTYSQILGKDSVRRIVVEVLEQKVKQSSRVAEVPKSPILEYDTKLVAVVSERILDSDLPPETTKDQAEVILREGFGRFVDHLVSFARERVEGPVIRLTEEIYEQYMNRPKDQQKCGEIPCNQPPCCKYCAPPPCPTH